jgi:cytochrome c oxidase subunit II
MKRRIIIPMFLTAVPFLMGSAAGSHNQNTRTIEIVASRFTFEPNGITVKKGEEVILAVHSKDANHGLVIEDLGIRTEIPKGQTGNITLKPETAGDFDGKCAHFCGAGHGSMTFIVHVVE